jgi:hypothetical protein
MIKRSYEWSQELSTNNISLLLGNLATDMDGYTKNGYGCTTKTGQTLKLLNPFSAKNVSKTIDISSNLRYIV